MVYVTRHEDEKVHNELKHDGAGFHCYYLCIYVVILAVVHNAKVAKIIYNLF